MDPRFLDAGRKELFLITRPTASVRHLRQAVSSYSSRGEERDREGRGGWTCHLKTIISHWSDSRGGGLEKGHKKCWECGKGGWECDRSIHIKWAEMGYGGWFSEAVHVNVSPGWKSPLAQRERSGGSSLGLEEGRGKRRRGGGGWRLYHLGLSQRLCHPASVWLGSFVAFREGGGRKTGFLTRQQGRATRRHLRTRRPS